MTDTKQKPRGSGAGGRGPWWQRLLELVSLDLFAVVAGIAIVALIDFSALARLWRAPEPDPVAACGAPSNVPRQREHMEAWCGNASARGEGAAYDAVGRVEMGHGRVRAALSFFEQAAERGWADAYETMGLIYAQGRAGEVEADMPRAIASFEKAIKLGKRDMSESLHRVYEGRLGTAQLQPRNAAMWAFGRCMIQGWDERQAIAAAQGYGLASAEIDEARDRMRRWIELNGIVPLSGC